MESKQMEEYYTDAIFMCNGKLHEFSKEVYDYYLKNLLPIGWSILRKPEKISRKEWEHYQFLKSLN